MKDHSSLFDSTGARILLNELFYSVQGEGLNAGRAAVFIRLAKCNLACRFCDTEFEVGRLREAKGIADEALGISGGGGVLVILTGGEPGLQNCGPLVDHLHERGFMVCLETSGSVWQEWFKLVDHICVSPKVPLDNIPLTLMSRAAELKFIVNAQFIKQVEAGLHIPEMAFRGQQYLQPESCDPKWTAAAVKLVKEHPHRYRLSLQTHKYIGVP